MLRSANWKLWAGILGLALIGGAVAFYSGVLDLRAPSNASEAYNRLARYVKQIAPREALVSWRAPVSLGQQPSLADTLPDISRYLLTVDPAVSRRDVVAEIFSSTEKSGQGTDGWLVALGEAFNKRAVKISNGKTAKVRIRHIASGTAYQFMASGKAVPDGYTPSNHLWIRMVEAAGLAVAPVSERLVHNQAGVVMKRRVAATLRSEAGDVNVGHLIEAVSQGRLAMGYTNPFASSTGLNFLVAVLQSFSDGDDDRMLSPEVTSAFETFQRGVPFVAHTTLQLRESVEKDGSLDAFVMEYQTFINEPGLQSDYEFIPFGINHDNPLYAVGTPSAEVMEVLQAFAGLAQDREFAELAQKYGFAPPPGYQPPYSPPDGKVIIAAQRLWKEKKHAGRSIAAVFLCDVSGSMDGVRIAGVREALLKAGGFIGRGHAVGMVTFASDVAVVLPIKPFDINHKGAFLAAAESLTVGGGTAMYDGVAVALHMLAAIKQARPEVKPMLFVLTDGETNEGMTFSTMGSVISALGIPVHTIGYEADIAELERLSSSVEATSLKADTDDIAYKLGLLFNAEM